MSYRFVGDKTGREPIPGIPLVCSDKEFAAAAEEYEGGFGPEAKGSLKKSGLYEHFVEERSPAKGEEE